MYPKSCTDRNLCKKQTKTHLHLQLKNIRQLCMAVLSISNRCAFCECELLRSAQPHWFALFLNPHDHLPMKTRKKAGSWPHKNFGCIHWPCPWRYQCRKLTQCSSVNSKGFPNFDTFFKLFLNWNFCECIFLFHVYQTGHMKLLCLGSALITHTWNSPLFKTLSTDQDQDM